MLSKKELVLKNYEKLEKEIMKAYKEMEGCMQGTRSDICIDLETEEVYSTSAMTQSTQTMESWKGEAIVVASVPAWEVGWEGFDYDFNETIKYEDNYDELIKEFDKVEEEYNDFYDFISEKHPKVIEDMDEDMRDVLLGEVFPDEASRKIEQFLEILEMEEEYHQGE